MQFFHFKLQYLKYSGRIVAKDGGFPIRQLQRIYCYYEFYYQKFGMNRKLLLWFFNVTIFHTISTNYSIYLFTLFYS